MPPRPELTEAQPGPSRTLAHMPDPITRTRARGKPRLHKLRRGRDRCGARCRDGHLCEAPAIKGGLRCLRHGGGSPQAQIAAQHRVLQLALYTAAREWEAARDTWRADCAMGRWSVAERELRAYEAKLAYLAELRAEVRQLKAGAASDAGRVAR